VTLLSKAQRKLLAEGNYAAARAMADADRKPRKPIRRKQLTAAEKAAKFAHEYGSKERREWISLHGCLACGRTPCENHHTSNGGKSKKGHFTTIVPLCLEHHDECHHGVQTFEAKYSRMLCGRTLKEWAGTYADAWEKWAP
jgi:hypothetical protein